MVLSKAVARDLNCRHDFKFVNWILKKQHIHHKISAEHRDCWVRVCRLPEATLHVGMSNLGTADVEGLVQERRNSSVLAIELH